MIKLILDHPAIENNELTTLTGDVAAAATALAVKNNDVFAQNDYVVVGKIGQETTEIRKIASVTGSKTVVVDALEFDHEVSTPIRKIDYNQIKIYSCATEDGTYELITDATVDIQVDSPDGTLYNHTAGTVTTWYKIKYYNSTSTALSDFSPPVQGSGFEDGSLKVMTDDILDMVNDPKAEYVTRDMVRSKINRHQKRWWFSPYTKRDLIKEQALKTNASDNFILLSELTYTFDKVKDDYSVKYQHTPDASTDEYYCLKILSKAQFFQEYGDNKADDSDDLAACCIDVANGKLLLGPTPVTADKNIVVEYYCKPSPLENDNDVTVCPVPDIINLAVAAEIEVSRGNIEKAKEFKSERNELIAGDLEHNRVKAGATKMVFKRSYDSRRFK